MNRVKKMRAILKPIPEGKPMLRGSREAWRWVEDEVAYWAAKEGK